MTTTFSLMAHFRPVDAFLNQPFGVVLFIATVIVFAIAAQEIAFPQKRWQRLWRWVLGREMYVVAGILVAMLAAWVYKVAIMGDFLSWPA
jgi:multisubunit Na+/H+ antiporter MnhB subunit